jgi:WD40 repeat protein
MKYSHSLLAALMGGLIAIVQWQSVAALTRQQIKDIGEKIIVLIAANGKPAGSGVMLAKQGSTYYVITAEHVVGTPTDYYVVTFKDKKAHAITYQNIIRLPQVDLAILQFESLEIYPNARELKLLDPSPVTLDTQINIFGYPGNVEGINNQPQLIDGKITSLPSQNPIANDGYALTYRAEALDGMSGGPVFNEQGRIIAIHGIFTQQRRSPNEQPSLTPFKLGIPLSTFNQFAPGACVEKGNEKLTQRNYQGAIANFNLALLLNDQYADAYINRGRAYLAMGESEKAIADASKALEINSQSAEAFQLRGAAYQQQNKPERATEDFNRASQITPNLAGNNNRSGTNPEETNRSKPGNTGSGDDRATRLPTNWALINTLNAESKVFAIAISPDGKILASGGTDGKIRLWDLTTQTIRRTLPGHSDLVKAIAFSKDGKMLASSGLDRVAKVWDVQTGNEMAIFREERNQAHAVAFNPNEPTLAIGLTNGAIKVCRVDTRSCRNIPGRLGGVMSLAYTPNGDAIASGSVDNTIRLWSVRQRDFGALIRTFTGHRFSILSLALSSDGQTLVSSSEDSTIKVWDTNTGQLRFSISSGIKAYGVAISPDGNILASSNNSEIKLWNLSNKQELGTLRQHTGVVRSLAFSSDGRLASGSEDNTISIWQRQR